MFWSPGPSSAGTGAQERGRGETNIRTGAFGDWAGEVRGWGMGRCGEGCLGGKQEALL